MNIPTVYNEKAAYNPLLKTPVFGKLRKRTRLNEALNVLGSWFHQFVEAKESTPQSSTGNQNYHIQTFQGVTTGHILHRK